MSLSISLRGSVVRNLGSLLPVFASVDVPRLEPVLRLQGVSVPVRARLMERTLMLMAALPFPVFLGIMYFAVIFVSNLVTVLIFVVRLLHFYCSVPASLTTDPRHASSHRYVPSCATVLDSH